MLNVIFTDIRILCKNVFVFAHNDWLENRIMKSGEVWISRHSWVWVLILVEGGANSFLFPTHLLNAIHSLATLTPLFAYIWYETHHVLGDCFWCPFWVPVQLSASAAVSITHPAYSMAKAFPKYITCWDAWTSNAKGEIKCSAKACHCLLANL